MTNPLVKLVKTSIRLADGRELIYYDEREGVDRTQPDAPATWARPAPPARSPTRCWRSG